MVFRNCLSLALGCSMQLGEILALQWANVYIEDEQVADGDMFLEVGRELHGCTNKSIEVLEVVNRSSALLIFQERW